ncbi:MerC domain-containing protein [Mucilaginibacter polytrichastri]|uniref:MerC domain-containing protein n=1 Tax=Mucilaginibacter polytrichastri TaxID=1302689 RepID=A0A1Q6A007_9SPHI|nr:MerC domain-containing protein [Mucilaginibacter polytrichastri]OKS87345.1 hypothetical protein RG47T_2806 [Mucilaginibacter polytrichastri]SFT21937.1 MerC mercury resistance protein [Mucilaginibacter polytrichastri]
MFKNTSNKMDVAGICVSILCAIHCALLPLVITLLPLIGLGFLANNYFEALIIAASLLIGYTSLTTSQRKHKQIWPLVILTTGFMVIFIGKMLINPYYEWLFLPAGGLLIASAHLYNSRLSTHPHEHY